MRRISCSISGLVANRRVTNGARVQSRHDAMDMSASRAMFFHCGATLKLRGSLAMPSRRGGIFPPASFIRRHAASLTVHPSTRLTLKQSR